MKRNLKAIIGLICTGLAFVVGLSGVENAHATETGSWIGSGSGGSPGGSSGGSTNCGKSEYVYHIGCAGVSWIYYEAVNPTGYPVTFGPFTKLGSSGSNPLVSIPSVCSNNGEGGFWHFGVNGQAAYGNYFMDFSSWYNHSLYETSQYSWGHWTTMNGQLAGWAPYSKPGQAGYETGRWSSYDWGYDGSNSRLHQDLKNENGIVYKAVRVANSRNDVLADYKVVLKDSLVKSGVSEAQIQEQLEKVNSIPNDVYAFCYWENYGEPDYYSHSAVKAGSTASEDTGISSSEKRVDVSVTVSTGELIPVEFTQRLYASTSTNDVSYNVKKTVKVLSGASTYNNEVKAGSRTDTSGTVNLTESVDSYYTVNKVQDSVGNWYLARDLYELSFPNEGKYEFCEEITATDKDGKSFPKTTACATIEVKEIKTSYYGQSNVAVRVAGRSSSDYSTTDIVASGEANAAETDIPVGQNVDLVFSHNIYAKDAKNGVSWAIERGSLTGTGYQIVSQPTCGSSGSANFTTKNGNKYGYYVGDPRNCSDGTNPFIARDVFTIRFTSENGYVERCETISVDGVQKTRVCARASAKKNLSSCGAWTPSSYTSSNASSGTTSVVSKVRNTSLTNSYADWQNAVYAKPTDKIGWINCYYPGVQFAYATTVTHENYHPEPTEGLWWSNPLNNHIFSAYSDWTNRYTISSHNLTPSFSAYESFAAGMTETKDTQNEYNVRTGQASETLWETITSGFPASVSASDGVDHSWACHWRCDSGTCGTHCCASHEECTETCTGEGENQSCSESCETVCDAECCNECYVDTCYHSDKYFANSRSGTASDTSYVYVPYNFSNTAAVNISNSVVYAGETATISSSTVTVNMRYNDVTQGTYATQVDDARAKLVGYLSSSSTGTAKAGYGSSDICSALSYIGSSCDELNSYNGMTFNSGASMRGSTDSLGFSGQTYNVYDAKAGDYYCVVVAVYPYTSGSDTNLNSSGSNNWYISAPSCRVIAKRPSFQVWGGSVYSEKSIKTSSAVKNNIRSVYSYTTTGKRNTTVYGSWVEQAVIANGLVSGLASGAASGDLTRAPWSGSKEGSTPNYCTYRVPLSIANYSKTASEIICPTYQQTGNSELPNAAIDRDALMSYWWVVDADYTSKANIDLATDYVETRSLQGNQIRYTQSSGNITIGSATIPKGATHIVEANGDVRINGNIVYQNTNYTTSAEIPKLLIYSTGDITVDCDVDRVDAIIVAEGQVSTCDSTDYNSRTNSRQLTINGMVIADSLVLNRTYGAATSVNSSVPAEIINYDTSAIIWGNGMADANDFETLTTVYQHEIAPRY